MKLTPRLTCCRLNAADRRLFIKSLHRLEQHTRLDDLKQFTQHGSTTCFMHSLAVAYVSIYLARRLHLSCNFRSLLVGALLHDYFLYDWHDRSRSERWHGFRHPRIAYRNASRDWTLDKIEADIIRKHMFPLTPVPPLHRESFLVCLADKLCSTYEIFYKDAYGRLKRELRLPS